ncbi:MAG: adenosine kinase [Nanoarchaeota archaeon]|nr:adenosine kinase [Nanoarchaeota archaeon]
MEQINLMALGNALTDIIIKVREKELEDLGVKKGGGAGIGKLNPDLFSKILSGKKQEICQAGSPTNTIFNASRLGLKTGLIGSIGYDSVGELYLETLKKYNIKEIFNRTKGKSGVCYILVTPDGERTNIASLGVSGCFNPDFKELEKLRAKIFHTSGYEVASNPEKAEEIVNYFKNKGAKISFDLAAESMVRKQRKTIENIVEKTDILFATEEEARELTGKAPSKALKELAKICNIVSLKRGKKGSDVKQKSEQYKIPAYPTELINTCGAGDAYASGFLFYYLRQFSLEECGRMGSYIASRACGIKSSHL